MLVRGESGTGKSTLTLELIRRGWMLIGDDCVVVNTHHHHLIVKPAPNLAGLIEVRAVGIVRVPFRQTGRLVLVADLVGQQPERYPQPQKATYNSLYVPLVRLHARGTDLCEKLETAFCHALALAISGN